MNQPSNGAHSDSGSHSTPTAIKRQSTAFRDSSNPSNPNDSQSIARDYYNSSDADHFYFEIWGGEDIHIGVYQSSDESIAQASQRTVTMMADLVTGSDQTSRILDIGAGYGGAARYLAQRFQCHVTALNLSEVENERNRERNAALNLQDQIQVIDGSFESLPLADQQFDLVWSQDAILHSDKRNQVLAEVSRVLKPNGQFLFTDPMKTQACPGDVLQPILDRIHLSDLGSPGFYIEALNHAGFNHVAFSSMPHQMANHYQRVLEETLNHESRLLNQVSLEYLDRMKQGLNHWIKGAQQGHLTWGIWNCQRQQD